MEKRSLYAFTSYKQIMTERLTGDGCRGQMSAAAVAMGCQRSYVSRVIAGKPDLTMDHAFSLALYWKLDSNETHFFLKLVEFERATNAKYKANLNRELQALRERHRSVQSQIKRSSLSTEGFEAKYFSSWAYAAIHFLTAIPKFQSEASLAKHLSLPERLVLGILGELNAFGFVSKKGQRWIYQSGEFHAERGSSNVQLHHQNWRHRSLLNTLDSTNQSVHFTGVLTVSESDRDKLKEVVLTFLAEANAIAGPSKPETAVVLLCDFFDV